MQDGGRNRAHPHASSLPLTEPRALMSSTRGTGHWAGQSDVSSTSRPLYSNFRTHFALPSALPRPPDAANTGFRSPALISTPQHARLASITRTLRALSSAHAPAAAHQGAGCRAPQPRPVLSGAAPHKSSPHAGARRLFLRLE